MHLLRQPLLRHNWRLIVVIGKTVMPMNDLQLKNLFAPIHTFGEWSVWSLRRDEILKTTQPKQQPILNGMYLLDGTRVRCYLGETAHACRRLRSHPHDWENAICLTLNNRSLSEDNRKHIEFAVGLLFLLTGTPVRNSRLDYPKPDSESARLAQLFLEDVFVPLLAIYGKELGLPRRGLSTALKHAHRLLGILAENGNKGGM